MRPENKVTLSQQYCHVPSSAILNCSSFLDKLYNMLSACLLKCFNILKMVFKWQLKTKDRYDYEDIKISTEIITCEIDIFNLHLCNVNIALKYNKDKHFHFSLYTGISRKSMIYFYEIFRNLK